MRIVPWMASAPWLIAARRRVGLVFSAVPLASAVLLAGCDEAPTIRHYQVSRIEATPTSAVSATEGEEAKPQRMIASIMPVGQQAWFVKGTGEPAAVAAQVEAWQAFLKSWKIDEAKGTPAWELPPNWTQRATAGPMRFATLDAPGVEFSITVLPMNASQSWDEYLAANVNRWRSQLQLAEATLEEIRSQVKTLPVGSVTATLVDLEGKSTGQSGMGPMARSMSPGSGAEDPHAGLPGFNRGGDPVPATPPAPASSAPSSSSAAASGFDFDVPTGWQPGKGGPFRLAAFEVESDGKKAEITLSALGSRSGTLLDNVNRWRTSQLGLGAVDDAQLAPLLSNVPIGDRSGQFVDLTKEDGELGMFAVILPMEDRTIFAKILGDKALVEAQRGAFEQFVKSLRPTTP